MKIAVLAWGSLLWSPRDLAVNGDPWNDDGPFLPIEFSRIASDGRLTLVIDSVYDDIRVYWKPMTIDNLQEAIQNLKMREVCDSDHEIGYVNCQTDEYNIRKDLFFLIDRLKAWGKSKSFDAVVWTDLLPRFYEKTGKEFSLDNAVNYLHSLEGEQFLRAKEYIEMSPPQTRTRFRKRLEEALNKKSR